MAAKKNSPKCSYTIFSSLRSKNKDIFKLKLKDGVISYNNYPVFLCITFDEYLNFKGNNFLFYQNILYNLSRFIP